MRRGVKTSGKGYSLPRQSERSATLDLAHQTSRCARRAADLDAYGLERLGFKRSARCHALSARRVARRLRGRLTTTKLEVRRHQQMICRRGPLGLHTPDGAVRIQGWESNRWLVSPRELVG